MRDQEGASESTQVQDYRLPKNVKPRRYEIRLEPDLSAFTFKGDESIAIVVLEPTTEIVLNALELEIDSATVEAAGKRLRAAVRMEPEKERAHLRLSESLAPGEYTLKLAFRGILNDKLHGFYRSQYTDAAG